MKQCHTHQREIDRRLAEYEQLGSLFPLIFIISAVLIAGILFYGFH